MLTRFTDRISIPASSTLFYRKPLTMHSNEPDRNLTALSGRVLKLRKVVAAKFRKVLHVSVSHDWALCTAYQDESDISVVLHRTAAGWTIAERDGGAYDAETLKKLGVPPADTAPLLKAYQ